MVEPKIETIGTDLYRIEVPLPGTPLGSINSYAILSNERNLIVDTGLNRKECLEALLDGLERVGADPINSDFFITHMHSDHLGLVGKLAGENSRVYLNASEIARLNNLRGLETIAAFIVRHGFPKERVESAMREFPGRNQGPNLTPALNTVPVEDGNSISYGRYNFSCVHTPGHSPGHTCLYEAEKKILFSGDHIIGNISPSIQCISENTNPLMSFLNSLEKVEKLDTKIILPGHRNTIKAPRNRILELFEHHRKRNQEILEILKKRPVAAYEAASHMKWDLHYDTWNQVPDSQKWFATGETIAHLRFLEEKGTVERREQNDVVMFSIR